MSKSSKRKDLLFAFLLCFFIYLCSEMLSFIASSIMERRRFSFSRYRSHRLAIIKHDISMRPPGGSVVISFKGSEVIHPYLGYVNNPDKVAGVSEYGFGGMNPLINPKSDDTLIIAIFGGSFAQGTSYSGRDALINELRHLPDFYHKELMIHTFAIGGYKQPQQLLALSYFLFLGAHFDIVINLDGFNEIALPPAENIPKHVSPFYPRNWFLRVANLNDSEMLSMIGEIAFLEKKRQDWARVFETIPLRYSITANFLWRWYEIKLSNQQINTASALQGHKTRTMKDIGYVVTGPPFHYKTESEMYAAFADVWKRCSVQMQALSKVNGIAYFHFLQPNQYVPGAKIMKQEESNIALQDEHPYRTSVEHGYPFLRRAGRDLVNQGVNFHDLTMIFANNDELLYSDSCCHLNEKGYSLIGATIGKTIVEYSKIGKGEQ